VAIVDHQPPDISDIIPDVPPPSHVSRFGNHVGMEAPQPDPIVLPEGQDHAQPTGHSERSAYAEPTGQVASPVYTEPPPPTDASSFKPSEMPTAPLPVVAAGQVPSGQLFDRLGVVAEAPSVPASVPACPPKPMSAPEPVSMPQPVGIPQPLDRAHSTWSPSGSGARPAIAASYAAAATHDPDEWRIPNGTGSPTHPRPAGEPSIAALEAPVGEQPANPILQRAAWAGAAVLLLAVAGLVGTVTTRYINPDEAGTARLLTSETVDLD
jgi:hypothetical protein